MMHESRGNERLERLQLLIRQNPQEPFLPYALGLEWEKQANLQRAEEIWRNLLIEHPDYLPAWQRLAELYLVQKQFINALHCTKEALRCSEKTGDHHAHETALEMLEQIAEQMKME
jgi:tetratricopeptide (TPR) repeat protein